ncbi:hypothetical protein Clacol_003941 [Clathrus columnatus]|uniref:F-box domain-containing protein n=1 Tax=Clathrus columnatus TaxID=1419009 RepID=A0AAV5A894_9AGAM|nr:hypothetical protein Clacol_003941 [Clathrus columnatus]
MATLPNDVLINIPQFIDDPKDLLAFALTAHTFYSEIVPKHIDYRRISCDKSCETVWKHLSESPYTRHVRSLNIMDDYCPIRTIPRVCPAVHHVGQMNFNLDAFVQALSKMKNLKVLKFTIDDSRENFKAIRAISRALGEAECELEEVETNFTLPSSMKHYIQRSGAIKGSQDCLIFCRHWPYLKKCIVTPTGPTLSCTDLGLQILLNAPNLTHIRHPKLITLSTQNTVIPGWTIESDDFLPNLTSLALAFPFNVDADINQGRVITSNMAARLTHLDMSDLLLSLLKEHKITLPSVDSCCYWAAEPEQSMIQDLSETIPNITKLYVAFGYRTHRPQPEQVHTGFRFTTNVQRQLTMDERLELSAILLISFKHLKVLFGPFDNLDIASDDYSLPRVLYNSPSLLYTRALWGGGTFCPLFRLARDSVAQKMTYESGFGRPSECNMKSWSRFYTRTPCSDQHAA